MFQSSSDAIFSKQVFLALHQAASSGIIVYVTILTGREKLKEKKKKERCFGIQFGGKITSVHLKW